MFVKRVLKASAISPGEMKACFPVFTSDNGSFVFPRLEFIN